MGRNTRLRLVFLPTLLSCSSSFIIEQSTAKASLFVKEVRNKIMKVEYRNAMDGMSVFRAMGNLHAIPNSCEKDMYSHIFSS